MLREAKIPVAVAVAVGVVFAVAVAVGVVFVVAVAVVVGVGVVFVVGVGVGVVVAVVVAVGVVEYSVMSTARIRELLAKADCLTPLEVELRNEIRPLLDRVERLELLEKRVRELIFEAEEYDFPDGIGKMALQQYWDDLQGALDAIDDAEDDAAMRGEGE